MKSIVFILLILIATSVTAAELHVAVPKSLRPRLIEISELFEKQNPDWKVKLKVYKSSDTGRLIEQGAVIDVFLSSDDKLVKKLQEQKRVQNVRRFLADDLVIIGPATSKLEITEPSKLSFPELKGIGLLPEKHPIGKMGRDYLKKLNLYDSLNTKFIVKNKLKEVVKSVVAGEVDWTFVYASDIVHVKGIKTLWKIPEKDVAPQVHYVGSVSKSQHQDAARLYLEILNSTIAIKLFENQGLRLLK